MVQISSSKTKRNKQSLKHAKNVRYFYLNEFTDGFYQ